MDFMPHYDGSYRGQGRLTPNGSSESYPVTYDLFETSEVLRHPGGGEDRRKVELQGAIDPIPEGVRLHVPHILELANGRQVECWIRSAEGKVVCQPMPGQS
jgi:hypothetical protein